MTAGGDPPAEFATSHLAWESEWQRLAATGQASRWRRPEAKVLDAIGLLRARAAVRLLDVGTGVGRHAIALAAEGFQVTAVDGSPAGVDEAGRAARGAGVNIRFLLGRFEKLPFDARSFDYVLAWNVLYHGDRDVVARGVAEIERVLVPGGLYQGTMLSKRNRDFGLGQEVAPGTFVHGSGERSHPHFYCSSRELLEIHSAFEPLALEDHDQDEGTERSGNYHWEFLMEKPA